MLVDRHRGWCPSSSMRSSSPAMTPRNGRTRDRPRLGAAARDGARLLLLQALVEDESGPVAPWIMSVGGDLGSLRDRLGRA
jgi:hypothetical protein